MYPSMPQPPVQAMQGQSPAQQFGYANAPMQQGIGSLVPQMPMYGAYPTYMAQGGVMPTMDQMAPQMPMGQAGPQFMAGGGPVGTQGDMMRQALMARSGKGQMQQPRVQQQMSPASGKGQMAGSGRQMSPGGMSMASLLRGQR